MKKYDGEFALLGMLIGIPIGMIFENLMFGIVLGIIIGIAMMDWLANLWNKYR